MNMGERSASVWRLCWVAWVVFASVVSAGATGCSGCGAVEECGGQVCTEEQTCVQDTCVRIQGSVCFPPCGGGESCQNGACVDVVDQCTAVGQVCDPFEPVSGQFYCIDWDGLGLGAQAGCSAPCAGDGTCAEGQTCFLLTGGTGRECDAFRRCATGQLCFQGACTPAACRPSECDGAFAGAQQCQERYEGESTFPDGAACLETGDGSRFCVPAGPRGEGEACEARADAAPAQRFDETCAPGLACVQGSCQRMCEVDEDCGDPALACLLQEEGVAGEGVGFCARSCAPFSLGQCGEGSKCLPAAPGEGYCVAAGEAGPRESCTPGAGECQEGLTCAEFGAQGRCMPLCDVTVAGAGAAVTTTDQARRDATCPQPEEVVDAAARLVHVAPGLGPVDLYVGDDTTPLVAGLGFGEVARQDGLGYEVIAPGTRRLEVRLAGELPTEAPLAELTLPVGREAALEVAVTAGDPATSERARIAGYGWSRQVQGGWVRVVNASPDAGAVDVVAGRAGGAPDGAAAVEVGAGLRFGEDAEATLQGEGWRVWVFGAGGGRAEEDALGFVDVSPPGSGGLAVYVEGTRAPDDTSAFAVRVAEAPDAPARAMSGLINRCTFATDAFGYCEQVCEGVDGYGAGACEGQDLACEPVQLPGFLGWSSLCRPRGTIPLGQACDPFADACVEGSYCLRYGPAAPGYDAALPGRCEPLCVVSGEPHPLLGCADGQSCRELDDEDFEVGRCGTACTPSGSYSDAVCPQGLMSCLPSARLASDPLNASLPPSVEDLPSFCSASGGAAEGAACQGGDCEPGLECLFPRSAQADLVSTLLSPYFGAVGLSPTCQAQCDPFDGVRSDTRCGAQETCLVNFPWSADVGHCAPIVEEIRPLSPCTRPGEACGQDSVCVIDGGDPFCLRLCEYDGGVAPEVFNRSTCPVGYECAPLVNDIGVCQTP
jgi:hypothetical protein